MKVIFLDIDGILNTHTTAGKPQAFVDDVGFNRFDPDAVKCLNKITDATAAKIVISSTWRIGCIKNNTVNALYQHLSNEGVTGEAIGTTPVLDGVRNKEVDAWLDKNSCEEYVILDDDLRFFSGDVPNLVHVENGWNTGLKDEYANQAIQILKESKDDL